MADRPVSPAEFAVRFGLEPEDVEWIMGSYRRGMPPSEVRKELEALGCSGRQALRLTDLIVEAVRRSSRSGPRSEPNSRSALA